MFCVVGSVTCISALMCGFTHVREMKTERHLRMNLAPVSAGGSVSVNGSTVPLALGIFVFPCVYTLDTRFPYLKTDGIKFPKMQCQVRFSGFPLKQVLHMLCIHGKLSDNVYVGQQKVSVRQRVD